MREFSVSSEKALAGAYFLHSLLPMERNFVFFPLIVVFIFLGSVQQANALSDRCLGGLIRYSPDGGAESVGGGGGSSTNARPNLNSNSYHERLGLEPGATREQVKEAYRNLARKHHPDAGGDEADFKKLNDAYVGLQAGESGPPPDSDKRPIATPADVEAAVMESLLADRNLVMGSFGRSLSPEKTRQLREEMDRVWQKLPERPQLDQLFQVGYWIRGHRRDTTVVERAYYMKRAYPLTEDVVFDLVEGIKGKEEDVECFWHDVWRYEEALGRAMEPMTHANFGALKAAMQHELTRAAKSYNSKLQKDPDSPDLANALKFINRICH